MPTCQMGTIIEKGEITEMLKDLKGRLLIMVAVGVVVGSIIIAYNKKATVAVNIDQNKIVATDSSAKSNGEIILGDKKTEGQTVKNGVIPYKSDELKKEINDSVDETNVNTTRPSDELEELSKEDSNNDSAVQFTGTVESISDDTYSLLITLSTTGLKVTVKKDDIENLDSTLKVGDTFVMDAYINKPIISNDTKFEILKVKSLLSVTTKAVEWSSLDAQENATDTE